MRKRKVFGIIFNLVLSLFWVGNFVNFTFLKGNINNITINTALFITSMCFVGDFLGYLFLDK